MLTRKQHELLLLIADRLGKTGISPSYDEMKEALGLKSKSGIHRLITALEERGFIRRLPHKARALEVLKMPEGAGDGATAAAGSNVIEPDFGQGEAARSIPTADGAAAGETLQLPLVGRIAAGTPIEALQNDSEFVSVPADWLGGGEHFALEVVGDSMVDAGIYDGDTAIIERGTTADNGEIVVALVDDEEATLKRLRRKGNAIALEAANEAYETRIFHPDSVRIQGRLTALLRRYH